MRDSVTFIHTADLHLDAPFQGIGQASERVGKALAEATYQAFTHVVGTALAREVDFVVIAGDSYNSRDKNLRAQRRFIEQMERLSDAGIAVFVAQGNHDPANGWSAGLKLPASVHVFASESVERFEVTREGEVIAAVYGRSFARASENTNLALGYRREPGDAFAVGVLHANVGGDPGYDSYAPATLDELRASRMDYWALGHIHKQEVLSREPWVVYAGSPQGLNPKEAGAHGCLIVEVSSSGAVSLEHVESAPIAWARLELDASDASDLDAVHHLVNDACAVLLAREGRNVIVRLTLTGRTEVHADLGRPNVLEDLLDELRADLGHGEPWLWPDRLDDQTRAAVDIDAVRSGADFAAEVVRIADELAGDPAQVAALVTQIVSPVSAALPGEYRPGVSDAEALESARDLVLDQILGGEVG